MRQSSVFSRCIPILILMVLLAAPSLSIQGACNGLLLWFQVILPTLSPFIICTQLVVALGGVELLVRPFYPLLRPLLGLSVSGAYVFICGLLCGYPLGARLCSDFLKQGRISYKEACYLLSICNHPSPMFLLGFVSSQLSLTSFPWKLLLSLYIPVIPISICSRYYYRINILSASSQTPELPAFRDKSLSLEEIILSTAETMVLIGGYIMLFSILAIWLQQLTFLSPSVLAFLSGIAEITTGVNGIARNVPRNLAFICTVAIVAFGGFSGIFQTKSVIKNTGLSIRHYLLWKIIHAIFACMIILLTGPAGQ